MTELRVVWVPEDNALVVRELEPDSCLDRTSRICQSRGVYLWGNGEVTKAIDGVVVAGPAAAVQLQGGQLPGPCVDPHSHAVGDHFSSGWHYGERAPEPLGFDLDDDGRVDVILTGDSHGYARDELLYVRRGECAYFVGLVTAHPEVLVHKTRGLHDLKSVGPCATTRPKDSDAICETVWRFDGSRYVSYREITGKRRDDNDR
jgi:hypothetical protein